MTKPAEYSPRKLLLATLGMMAMVAALLAAGSLLFHSARITLGVLAGAAVVMVNFAGLFIILSAFFSIRSKGGSGGLYLLLYILKFFVIIGIAFLLIYSGRIDPAGFFVGVTTLLIALVAMAVAKQDVIAGGR